MTNVHHPRFNSFLKQFESLIDSSPDEPAILQHGGELLRDLVAEDNWLPQEFATPHPDRYTQYLLHVDGSERFSIVSFVWGPGQRTPIHNHTVWGLLGVLRGAELAQRYAPNADGSLAILGPQEQLDPGGIEAVSPFVGDLHAVSNAYDDRVSVSVHIYGADIGKVIRSVFEIDGTAKTFISGYVNV